MVFSVIFLLKPLKFNQQIDFGQGARPDPKCPDLISGKGRLIDVVSLGSQAGFMYIDEVVTPWLPAPIRLPFQQTINMLDQGSAYLYRQASGGN